MTSPLYLQSKQSTWQTPEWLLERVRTIAPIGLDPATTAENPTKARYFFTPSDNGLIQDWGVAPGEAFFVNPPYARGETSAWVTKIVSAWRAYVPGVALMPAWTGTAWCQSLLHHARVACFLERRVSFVDPETSREIKGNTVGSIVFARGVDVMRFNEEFHDLGCVVFL